ncbi:MAG: ABC transporter permease [Chloroflexi bacterium]|nr:ABC transporter permease [Chloroflexota bacterium]
MSHSDRITPLWTALRVIVWKDLTTELRSRELLSGMLLFSVSVLLIFNFALELNARSRAEAAAGILWSTLIFAGTLGLNRSMASEKEQGGMDGLLLAPMDRSAIYFGKMIANWLLMMVVAGVTGLLYSILYNQPLTQPGLWLVFALGSLGYVAAGTLLAAMTVQTRARELLLPILLLPLLFPLLMAAVRSSMGFLQGLPFEEFAQSVHLLIGIDGLFIALGYLLFDFVMAE